MIEALRRLDRERAQRIRHPLLHEAVGRSTNLMISHIAAGDPGVLARAATRCVFGGALSFPTPESLEAVRREIENAVQAAAAGDDWLADHPPEVVFPSGTSAAEISADSTLFEAVAGAVSAVTGQTPLINPMHTGSDIRNPIVQKGIPTLGLGPLCGDLTQNGAHDEWVDVAQHLQAAEAAAGIVARWCGVTAKGISVEAGAWIAQSRSVIPSSERPRPSSAPDPAPACVRLAQRRFRARAEWRGTG